MKAKDYRSGSLLEAVAEVLARLFEPGDFDEKMNGALRLIGEADDADRVYVFENHPGKDGAGLLMDQRYEWVRTGVSPQIGNALMQNMPYSDFPGLYEQLRAGYAYQRLARNFSEVERRLFIPQEILSLACMPLILRGELWGFVGLDNCREERVWTEEQLLTLKAVTAGIGGAIVRQQIEKSLQAQAEELKRQRTVALSLMEDARLSEQAAARASQAKTTFLAMMSHEIRTPLNGVIGFTDLLLADGLPGRHSEIAHAIRACGESLHSLISDILDITKIESDRLDIHPTYGNIEECIQSIVSTFEHAVHRSGVVLALAIEENCPRWLKVDFKRLRQILINLVGNAVKFTRRGRIEIRASVERDEAHGLELVCRVSDTGPGIASEDLKVIFDPFQQGENTRRVAAGGSGLGLAICRKLAEAMGGQITAVSALGKGAEFTLRLPVQEGRQENVRMEKRQTRPKGDASVHVLVVDDVPVNVRLVVNFLQRLGYVADEARGGAEAVRMAGEKPYALVFMDILMPEVDGYEAVRQIRQHESLQAAAPSWIVALTADALVENRERCAEAGMNDFVTKPLRMKDMESCIERWLAGRSPFAAQP